MDIKIRVKEEMEIIKHYGIFRTYTKDGMYCIDDKGMERVYRYPIGNILEIEEEYDRE